MWDLLTRTRTHDGALQVQVDRPCDPAAEPQAAAYAAQVQELAADLHDARVVKICEWDGRDTDMVYVRGWRDATDAEVAAYDAHLRDAEEAHALAQVRQAAALRRERPDLFE